MGEKIIGPYFRREGIRKIDLVFLTHPHYNHMRGLRFVIEHFSIGTVCLPTVLCQNYFDQDYYDFLHTVVARSIPVAMVQDGDTIQCDTMHITVMNPSTDRCGNEEPDSRSLMLSIQSGERRCIITGDSTYDVQEALSGRAISADLLHIPRVITYPLPHLERVPAGLCEGFLHPGSATLPLMSESEDSRVELFQAFQRSHVILEAHEEELLEEVI